MRYSYLSMLAICFYSTAIFAQNPAKPTSRNKKIIRSDQAPQPIGPYSQGVIANGLLFISGQLGINPETKVLLNESYETETTQVMENLKTILKAAGLDFKDVVKTTIFVKDISQFAKVNETYGKYFVSEPPARETVQVANLPGNANIEISMIAITK
ncbi:RidA family protein [Adhaeribacter aquaticus]|uniref:RidA family protein n=1 Tax=Adhaeribacter aquaticus TaxID=299567 RepID=UPI0004187483|nr:RidA family protein [Adhaeribacter aquaticus]